MSFKLSYKALKSWKCELKLDHINLIKNFELTQHTTSSHHTTRPHHTTLPNPITPHYQTPSHHTTKPHHTTLPNPITPPLQTLSHHYYTIALLPHSTPPTICFVMPSTEQGSTADCPSTTVTLMMGTSNAGSIPEAEG